MKHACDYGVWDAAHGATAQLESFSSKPLQRRDASIRNEHIACKNAVVIIHRDDDCVFDEQRVFHNYTCLFD